MTCAEFIDRLPVHLDGDPDGLLPESFARHHEVCPECRRYLEGYLRTTALVRGLGRRRTDAPLSEALVRAVTDVDRARIAMGHLAYLALLATHTEG